MAIAVKGVKKLDGEDRYYEWNGERFPSVTTVLNHCIPKPALHKWKAKLVASTAIAELAELSSRSPEDAEKYLLALADDAKDAKASVGTEVHAYAEAAAYGRPAPKASEKALPYIAAYEAFQYDVKPQYTAVELPVLNRTHMYAGTADIYALINERLCIIDIKTGRSVWPEVALQLAAYARSEFAVVDGEEQPSPAVERGYVLHLSESGYELRRCSIADTSFNAFLAGLDLFNWLRDDSKYAIGGLVEGAEIV